MPSKNNPKIFKDFWELSNKENNKKKMTKPEIRKDYLQDNFVVICPKRKWKIKMKSSSLFEKRELDCNLCPENINKERAKQIFKKKDGWAVKTVANKYPAFSTNNQFSFGTQEIVIETPYHNHQSVDFSVTEIEKVIKMYIERTLAIRKIKGINYILIFKNSGKEAGASQNHAHSQIYATKFIPFYILDKIKKERECEGCVYCDIIKKEKKGSRMVFENKNFIVLCPYASQHSYEIMVLPKRHLDNISELNTEEKKSLAKIFKAIFRGIKDLGYSYNMYFHEVVKDLDQHIYFKFKPRTSVWAGLEVGSGLIINPIPPEDATEFYKKYFRK
ncbi:MAG: hypothetical protein COU51_01690 [Parcubacteria group bacterium CG10_big_fil_rev_8_21_14_0_10_36_14]|nr:MAG: hypothetical protein COU51_01690 [Parcubacteria group bacterium CG10_big_fil_rev_8_21_14_0_10_36_14]